MSGIAIGDIQSPKNTKVTSFPKSGVPLPSGPAAQQDAYAILKQMLDSWGLSSLAQDAWNLVTQGLGSDAIILQLQQTDAYKQRFAANQIREKNGLPVLSPAQYIATEQAYRQVLSQYGLPKGFYDSTDDFTKWIAGDTSPAELDKRAQMAYRDMQEASPEYKAALKQFYGMTDGQMLATMLDPSRMMSDLNKMEYNARIGAIQAQQGVGMNLDSANKLFQNGVSENQALQGYHTIGSFLPEETAIAQRFGQSYNQQDAENEVLFGDQQAALKRQRLNQSEQATFAGSSGGADSRSLTNDAGSF